MKTKTSDVEPEPWQSRCGSLLTKVPSKTFLQIRSKIWCFSAVHKSLFASLKSLTAEIDVLTSNKHQMVSPKQLVLCYMVCAVLMLHN